MSTTPLTLQMPARSLPPMLSARAARGLMLAAVILGIASRLLEYGRLRSLWHDETSIALNIRHKTARQLLGALEYDQAAPPLFLLGERALLLTLGESEASLRLLPLAAGIASVLLFAGLSRRILPTPWDAIATFLFALSDKIIERNTEIKPYGVDVAVSVLLLYLATSPRSLRWRLTTLSIAGTIGVALSFPAVLVFAAIGLALLPEVLFGPLSPVRWGEGWGEGQIVSGGISFDGGREPLTPALSPEYRGEGDRRWRTVAGYLFAMTPVAVTFIAIFLLSRATQHNTTLIEDWRDEFLDWHKPLGWPLWMLRRTWAACDYAFPATGPVVLIGGLFGVAALRRKRQWSWLMMFGGPIILALVAASLHAYPYDGGRLTAFLTPGILLLAMIGWRSVYDSAAPRLGRFAALPTGYLLAVAVFWAGLHAVVPRHRDHFRPVAAYVRQHLAPDETVYTFELRMLQWYWPDASPANIRGRLDAAADIPGKRFWIVWSYSNLRKPREIGSALDWAREFCDEKDKMIIDGGGAILFVRRDGAVPRQPVPPYRGQFDVVRW